MAHLKSTVAVLTYSFHLKCVWILLNLCTAALQASNLSKLFVGEQDEFI